MRALLRTIAAALVLAASPAAAQLSNHSIAFEAGLSARHGSLHDVDTGLAVSASRWMEGDVEAVARVAFASAAETDGRATASAVSGTLGLRLSLLPDPVRPQLDAELGWSRVFGPGAAEDHVALGIGAGVEWFPARDTSIALRAALRGRPAAAVAEATLAAAIYF